MTRYLAFATIMVKLKDMPGSTLATALAMTAPDPDWKDRLRQLLKERGWTYRELAENPRNRRTRPEFYPAP